MVTWRLILSADESIFARQCWCVCVCLLFNRLPGLFSETIILRAMRHRHTPQDFLLVLPITAAQTLYIILFEGLYLNPNSLYTTHS